MERREKEKERWECCYKCVNIICFLYIINKE